MSPLNERVSLKKLLEPKQLCVSLLLGNDAAVPVAGDDKSVTFRVGDDLVLRALFSNFILELDEISWTHNSSLSLVDGVDGVSVTNSDLSAPEATSTLTRPNITGVSYAGTYVATASNRAGSSSITFTVEITGKQDLFVYCQHDLITASHIVQSALFQLHFVDISDCVQWRVSVLLYVYCVHGIPNTQELQSGEKKDAVIAGVTRAVEEICQCGFSREAFLDVEAGFQCFDESPTAVTFRAVIMDIAMASSSQLIGYIEEWIATQPSIVILSTRLSIDSSCTVEIQTFSAAECTDMTPSTRLTDGNNNTNIASVAGGVVGGVTVLLIVIVLLVLVVVFLRNKKKKATYKIDVHKEDIDIYE